MNETLRRALMHARLSEEDVAAHLQVDPKTVRRWLEGRTPYLRHRWALCALLGLDEADLWPRLHSTRSRHKEVRAIYPHSGSISRKVWQEFFQSAQHEIGVLARGEAILEEEMGILDVLRERTEAGTKVRICLSAPDSPRTKQALTGIADTFASHVPDDVEIRMHRITLHNSIYRADDELIISQYAFGIPADATPAVRLRKADSAGLAATYLESFHSVWADSKPIT